MPAGTYSVEVTAAGLFISWSDSGQGPLASPVIQTIGGLPSGTSAPNTVVTEQAVSRYHLTLGLNGWLIQAPAPLAPAQIDTARQLALSAGVTIETQAGAILGVTGAVITCLAWAHSNLSAMFGDVPLDDVLILLIGLPLVAAVAGWLLAGREPPLIARQPIE